MFYTEVNNSMDIEILVDDFATFYIAGEFVCVCACVRVCVLLVYWCLKGQEATGNLLVFAVVLLLQHPDVLER